MKIAAGLFLILMISACDVLPRDTDGTLNRIHEAKIVRVGLVAPTQLFDNSKTTVLIALLEQRTQASARIERDAAEPLLSRLDNGGVDIVIGPFAKDTPWKEPVALAPPIAVLGEGDKRIEWRAALRNGENRWIMLVEDASRTVGGAAAKQ